MFEDRFIQELADDPVRGVVRLVDAVEAQFAPEDQAWSAPERSALLEGLSLLLSLINEFDLPQILAVPSLSGELDGDCKAMWQFLREYRQHFQSKSIALDLEQRIKHYSTALGSRFAYEFSAGDLARIQQVIDELRKQITQFKQLEVNHRDRLLKRLEGLQRELHKRVSDLDKFWGLVGDAGVILGKFGKDAKPMVDRIREIVDIVWRTQSRAEELESNIPTPLPSKDDA